MPLAGFDVSAMEVLRLTLHEWQTEYKEVTRVECHYCDDEDHDLEEEASHIAVFLGANGSLDGLLVC